MYKTVEPVYGCVERLARLISRKLVAEEDKFTSVNPFCSVTVQKDRANDIVNQRRPEGTSYFDLPEWCDMVGRTYPKCTGDEIISVQVLCEIWLNFDRHFGAFSNVCEKYVSCQCSLIYLLIVRFCSIFCAGFYRAK